MGNERNRSSKRVESQSSDREENTSETSFTQGNATLVEVSEQNNQKMTQIEQQLNVNSKRYSEESEQIEKAIWRMMKRMPRTINLALQIQKISISGENTHQTMKSIKTEIRIIAFSPQKCMN